MTAETGTQTPPEPHDLVQLAQVLLQIQQFTAAAHETATANANTLSKIVERVDIIMDNTESQSRLNTQMTEALTQVHQATVELQTQFDHMSAPEAQLPPDPPQHEAFDSPHATDVYFLPEERGMEQKHQAGEGEPRSLLEFQAASRLSFPGSVKKAVQQWTARSLGIKAAASQDQSQPTDPSADTNTKPKTKRGPGRPPKDRTKSEEAREDKQNKEDDKTPTAQKAPKNQAKKMDAKTDASSQKTTAVIDELSQQQTPPADLGTDGDGQTISKEARQADALARALLEQFQDSQASGSSCLLTATQPDLDAPLPVAPIYIEEDSSEAAESEAQAGC
eukprot:2078019-Amphidinium_carterae.4